MSLLIGRELGPYRILEQIGMGGMAKVYKAFQANMERYVALKVLPARYADEPQFAKRFIQEARCLARLTHPHIARVHSLEHVDGDYYLVMEFLEGGSLGDRLEAEGAGDVSVEFGSFSKSYNMAGWRLGYCVGNEGIMEGVSKFFQCKLV